MREAGIKFIQQKPVKVHPIKEGRRVPLKQLILKLKLQDYDVDAPYNSEEIKVSRVQIPLQQHIGTAASSIVRSGQLVEAGQLIAEVAKGKLGASVHASIGGKVTSVNEKMISIET